MKRSLVSITPDGKDLLCKFRYEDGSVEFKKDTSFKPYFYASNVELPPIVEEIKVKKIIANHPKDVPQLRNNFKYTFESEILYDIRYVLDHRDLLDSSIKPKIMWIDIEASVKMNGKVVEFKEVSEGKTPILNLTCIIDDRIYHLTTLNIDEFELYDTLENQYKDYIDKVFIEKFDSEKDMLEALKCIIVDESVDIISGWNVKFDMHVILTRCKMYGINLSQFEEYTARSSKKILSDGKTERIDFYTPGFSVIDYFDIFRKIHPKTLRSYTLDYVSNEVGAKVVKIRHSYGSDFDEFANKDPILFSVYNIIDTLTLKLMESALGYFDIMIMLCYEVGCPFKYCIETSKLVDCYIISELKKIGKVRRSKSKDELENTEKFKGAYVDLEKGFWKYWCCDLDFTSLYPMIIISLNISPETYVGYDIDGDYVRAPNGARFKKDRGIIPEILDNLFKKRKSLKSSALEHKSKYAETKDEYHLKQFKLLWNKQASVKVLLNSFYGVLGKPNYALYMPEIAETITLTGQYLIKFAREKIHSYGYKVIYTDTDSCYVALKPTKFGDINDKDTLLECIEMIKDIGKRINKEFDTLEKEWNLPFGHRFNMKTELLARHMFIWQKKNYAFIEVLGENHFGKIEKGEIESVLNSINEEFVVKGALIKSDIPAEVAKFFRKCIEKLLKEEFDEKKFIAYMRHGFFKILSKKAEQDITVFAKTLRKTKVPVIKDKVWMSIERYNREHPTSPINLGEKIYYVDTVDGYGVVWKYGEDPPEDVDVDISSIYNGSYKNYEVQFIEIVSKYTYGGNSDIESN